MTQENPARRLDYLSDGERVTGTYASHSIRVRRVLSETELNISKVFGAANLHALRLFRLGEVQRATDLCKAEIACSQRNFDRPTISILGLDPQVNLIRIEGFVGDAKKAVTNFQLLKQLLDGKSVCLPNLAWQAETLESCPRDTQIRVLGFVRNAIVVDTCKILLRRNLWDDLREQAEGFKILWPRAIANGLHHPVEVPYIVDPAIQDVPPLEFDNGHLGARRSFIQILHLAGFYADEGDTAQAITLIKKIEMAWEYVSQNDLSPSTLGRWQVNLAQTYRRIGQYDKAQEMLIESWSIAKEIADEELARQALMIGISTDPLGTESTFPENQDLIRSDALDLCQTIEETLEKI